MISKIKKRMDKAADKMARVQTTLFLNLFYITAAPIASTYLRLTRRLHHKQGGYFSEVETRNEDIDELRKQY